MKRFTRLSLHFAPLLPLLLGLFFLSLSSCNVVRTVTTEAKSIQRGDSVFHVSTRTIERYDASKQTNF